MKISQKLLHISLLLFFTIGLASCDSDDNVDIVEPTYKTINVASAGSFDIPILTDSWTIEYIEDIAGNQKMTDKDGQTISLKETGTVESATGWLALTRSQNDKFTLDLKENFDKNADRKFIICINSEGHRNYVTVTQKTSSEYKLVKTEFTEIESERKVYTNSEQCDSTTLTNSGLDSVWMPYEHIIFKNVTETSEFESESFGAFEWMPSEGINISTPEITIDGNTYAGRNYYPYLEEVVTFPYNTDKTKSSTILIKPGVTLNVKGEITYCKRVFNYTFIIENTTSGAQFEIHGLWREKVKISTEVIMY